ncbi:hypothetical protein DRJ17_00090 [Candidatus Woesearchaeota archaeon]|nr:MAG: hypothetical protein DRJ17_00090 [Candidatus Woesearchaeota archaeon]
MHKKGISEMFMLVVVIFILFAYFMIFFSIIGLTFEENKREIKAEFSAKFNETNFVNILRAGTIYGDFAELIAFACFDGNYEDKLGNVKDRLVDKNLFKAMSIKCDNGKNIDYGAGFRGYRIQIPSLNRKIINVYFIS